MGGQLLRPFLHCFNRGTVMKSLKNMLGDSYYDPRLFGTPEYAQIWACGPI